MLRRGLGSDLGEWLAVYSRAPSSAPSLWTSKTPFSFLASGGACRMDPTVCILTAKEFSPRAFNGDYAFFHINVNEWENYKLTKLVAQIGWQKFMG